MGTTRERGRILVVDDEPALVRLYCMELEERGHEVDSAENGEVALEKIAGDRFDLVLLDIRMPVMDGMETLGRILDLEDPPRVILNTAYRSYRGDFLAWAADAYVEKGSDLTELHDEIERVLAAERKCSGAT